LVFKSGGAARLPDELPAELTSTVGNLNPPPLTADFETVAHGEQVYGRYCSVCPGPAGVSASAGTFPDLRYSQRLASAEMWDSVVLGGELVGGGMVSFEGTLESSDPDAIRQYIISRANADKEAGGAVSGGALQ
jgi:mono/diheme cytochrome c family protein